jgi:hypothetical protein
MTDIPHLPALFRITAHQSGKPVLRMASIRHQSPPGVKFIAEFDPFLFSLHVNHLRNLPAVR